MVSASCVYVVESRADIVCKSRGQGVEVVLAMLWKSFGCRMRKSCGYSVVVVWLLTVWKSWYIIMCVSCLAVVCKSCGYDVGVVLLWWVISVGIVCKQCGFSV